MPTFTTLGQELQAAERLPEFAAGAQGHADACAFDAGKHIVLTGRDVHGKRVRKEAKSVFGAFATMQAVWGVQRAYIFDDNGRRRLIIKR